MKSSRLFTWLVVLVLVWLVRPFWHPLVMEIVIHPLYLLLLIAEIWLIVSVIKMMRGGSLVKEGISYRFKPAPGTARRFAIVVIVIIVLGVIASVEQSWRYRQAAGALPFATREALPDFTPIRLVPKAVATRFAEDSFQSPQEHLGDSQIALVDGHLERVFPRLPDGWLLYFTKQLSGFVTVNVDSLERQVKIEDQPFKYAEHIGVFDNLYFRLAAHRYFVTYSAEPVYLKNDTGQWVTVVPFMSYKGMLIRTPYWAGVSVITSDGTITDYTPEQTQQISYLKNNRLYPKELTVFAADAYAYRGGILNIWFLHKNQTETVRLPSDETVIHAATAEGLKQVVVAEPYGRSYGIYKIFIVDAGTGKQEMVEYDMSSQLTGPVAAADYIKREFPTYNWNTFNLQEPRPLTIGGQLHWLLSIVPNDNAGIATTVLLNTKTNQVTKIDSVDQLDGLIAGKVIPSTAPADSNAQIKAAVDSLQTQLDALKKLLP